MFCRLKLPRAVPEKNRKRDMIFSLCAALLGLALGCIAKAADSVSLIGEIGTDLGIWVCIAALIGAFSRTPILAAINVLLFFLSMLASYYLYGHLVLGFFPREYFWGWLLFSLMSPIGGLLVWFSRGKGFIAALCASLPAALLFAWGHPAFYTRQLPLILDMLFGLVLLAVLTKTWRERAIAICLSGVFAFLIVQTSLLQYFPF